jgi:methyl-accepting chemotaxis protein
MFPKWRHHLGKYRTLYLGLLLCGLFIFTGLNFLTFSLERIGLDEAMIHRIGGIILPILSVFGFGMLFLIWLNHSANLKPGNLLVQTGQKLSQEDMALLSTALTDLSQGDLSRNLQFDNNPLQLSETATAPIASILNNLIENMNDAAQAFNNITGVPCKRLFYVGADSFLEGRKCGEIMGRLLEGKGEVIVTAESFKATNLDLRRRGFIGYLREKHPKIKIVAQVEASAGGGQAYHVAMETLKEHPHISGIYVACGSPPAQFAKALVAFEKAGIVKVVCHDLMDDTMRWVKDGVITATLSQNSFAQGYDPVIHMFNHLAAGWKPPMPFLLTDLEEVNQNNFRDFWHEEKGMIFSKKNREKMAIPLIDTAAKPLRIAVIGRDETAFWLSVRQGVEEAIKKLEKHNVTVDFLVPEEVYQLHDIRTEFYGPLIEKVIENQYDGLVTVAPEKGFIPYINKAVDRGVPVGLYNSDPVSLRGLIFTISDQARTLMGISKNLATNTIQSGEAVHQIAEAMSEVAKGTETQNSQVVQTEDTLHNLLNSIDLVSRDAANGAKATEETSQAVTAGTEAMKNSLETMKEIENSVTDTWGIVEDLSTQSDQIGKVVDVINDIASRVNVLALNAAIEATKAGDFGKGFMVVAREIRSLANQTSEATREVALLIHTVQGSIDSVDKVMSSGLKKMKKSGQLTDQAVSALIDIQKLVQSDKQRMQSIASAIIKMQNSSHAVGEAMQQVASVSEMNTKSVNIVDSLTKSMSEQLQTINGLVQSVEEMARSEQQMLTKFTLMETVRE